MDDIQSFKQMSRTAIGFFILYGLFLIGCGFLTGNLMVLIIGALGGLSTFILLIFLPRMRRRVQRRQEMRQAAVTGDTSLAPLAFPQPAPDEHALPLPLTVKLKPTVSMALFVAGLITVIWVVLLTIGGLVSEGWTGTYPMIGTSIPITLCILFFPFPLLFIPALFLTRQRIEVTDKSLTIREFNNTSSVRWDEVKLFATTPPKKGASVTFYELSTTANVLSEGVSLQRLRRDAWLIPLKPETSFDEYNRQMDALLSLIAAKTGLPLYDLR